MANQPIKTIRAGRVCASIWENQTRVQSEVLIDHTVNIERRYPRDNKWHSTCSFYRNDLPRVMLVAQKAYEWLTLNGEQETNEQQIPSDPCDKEQAKEVH